MGPWNPWLNRKYICFRKRLSWRKFFLAGEGTGAQYATVIVTAIITGSAIYVAYKQGENSIQVAEKSSYVQSLIESRPYLKPIIKKLPSASGTLRLGIKLTNIGRAPAYRIHVPPFLGKEKQKIWADSIVAPAAWTNQSPFQMMFPEEAKDFEFSIPDYKGDRTPIYFYFMYEQHLPPMNKTIGDTLITYFYMLNGFFENDTLKEKATHETYHIGVFDTCFVHFWHPDYFVTTQ